MNLLGKDIDLSLPRQHDEPEYSNVQLTRLFRFIRSGLLRLMAVGVVVAISNAAFTALTTAAGHERDDKINDLVAENAKTIEVNRKQAVGANVANCAYQNIARNAVADVLTRLERARAFRDAPEVDAALDESRKELAPVDCKVVAPERDRINIELNYPTTLVPPK